MKDGIKQSILKTQESISSVPLFTIQLVLTQIVFAPTQKRKKFYFLIMLSGEGETF